MPWWTVDVQMRRYVDGSCDVRQSLAPPAHARNVEFMLDLTEMSPRSLLLHTMCVGPTLSSSSLLPPPFTLSSLLHTGGVGHTGGLAVATPVAASIALMRALMSLFL
jgi:hypothetical protein